MRRAALLLVLATATAHAQDARDPVASVEITLDDDTCFVGEPIVVGLRVSFDTTYVREHAVQPFHRSVGVPLRVEAEWMEGLTDVGGGLGAELPPTFALNDEVVQPHFMSVEDGVSTLHYSRVARFDTPREVTFSAPTLQLVVAEEFRESFVDGRVAVDPRPLAIDGAPRTITVRPLPDEGRPSSFTGGVGSFRFRAETATDDVEVGESLKLVLHVEGLTNLDTLAAPRLDDLPGFHVYGFVDKTTDGARSFTYDIAPLTGDVHEIPAIEFAFFDPDQERYVTLKSDPIPLTVRGEAAAPEPGVSAPADDATPVWPWAIGIAVLAIVVMLVLRSRRPATATATIDDVERFSEAIAAPSADVADALATYLAARLQTTAAAVIAPGLAARLVAVGVQTALAEAAAAHLEALVAERYGGSAVPDRIRTASALVARLDEQLA